MNFEARRLADVTVEVFGPLRMTDRNGVDLLPKAAKTRGLLALLCTGTGQMRARQWLQEMLWSDRAQPQRAASLRQSLTDLRRALGPYADLVISNRQSVTLDPARLEVITQPKSAETTFLEGVHVADPAFSDWLSKQRVLRGGSGPVLTQFAEQNPERTVIILGESDEDPARTGLEATFCQILRLSLRERCAVEIGSHSALRLRPDCLLVSIKAVPGTGQTQQLHVCIEDIAASRICWNSVATMPDAKADPFETVAFLALCNQTAEATLDALVPEHHRPDGSLDARQIGQVALRKLFAITAKDVADARELFALAYSIDPQPVYQAWQAQAITIQYIERYLPLDAALREQSEEACRKALIDGHNNATVLAIVANTRSNIERNYTAAIELSVQAVHINPANPMAWYAYSNAAQCVGRSEEAYQAALIAQALAQTTRMKFWCDCQVSISAAMAGKTDAAVKSGERAHAIAPGFKPPLRYLTALYALGDRADEAERAIANLRKLEPEFAPEQMVKDPSYPVGILRRYGKTLTANLRKSDLL